VRQRKPFLLPLPSRRQVPPTTPQRSEHPFCLCRHRQSHHRVSIYTLFSLCFSFLNKANHNESKFKFENHQNFYNLLCNHGESYLNEGKQASVAVINAIKSLPMSQKSGRAKRGGVLCRSLSRKLLSRSFWRKATAVREEGSQGVSWCCCYEWCRKKIN